jgi:hypothetical protein
VAATLTSRPTTQARKVDETMSAVAEPVFWFYAPGFPNTLSRDGSDRG